MATRANLRSVSNIVMAGCLLAAAVTSMVVRAESTDDSQPLPNLFPLPDPSGFVAT